MDKDREEDGGHRGCGTEPAKKTETDESIVSDVETQADFELDFLESERKEKTRRINGVREMEELLKEKETRRRNTAKSWRRNGSRRIIEVKG